MASFGKMLAMAMAVSACAVAQASSNPYEDLLAARKAFDEAAFLAAQEALIARADSEEDGFGAQIEAAEALLLKATWLRNTRMLHGLGKKKEKALQGEQTDEATLGISYAERALGLGVGTEETSRAERVLGELYSHLISGMMSGMRNGPKAKAHIRRALDLTPENPEAKRAIGLMYLHNPPFSGGDVPLAIETFAECSASDPGFDVYPALLAMAYRKAKKPELAREAAERALAINPANKDAKAIIEALGSK